MTAENYGLQQRGHRYEFGWFGFKKDFVAAAECYQQAVEAGNISAYADLGRLYASAAMKADEANNIGFMYGNAQGVACDYAKALEWYKKSAHSGSAVALANIGALYESGGFGVVKNFVTAAKYYRQAVEAGNVMAQAGIDRLFSLFPLFSLFSASAVHAEEAQNIGYMYSTRDAVRDYTKALQWYRKAAASGNALALENIGVLYENGFGVAKDIVTAAKYYRQAVVAGNFMARAGIDRLFHSAEVNSEEAKNIGYMYNTQDAVRDYTKAFQWYNKAAKSGNAVALEKIGILYENGFGVARDIVKAAEYYQRAIESGCLDAQALLERLRDQTDASNAYAIGLLYSKGDKIKRDYVKAHKWFLKSAEGKHAIGSGIVGLLYEFGCGVTQNVVAAAKYYQQAIEAGNTKAHARLNGIYAMSVSRAEDRILERERVVHSFKTFRSNAVGFFTEKRLEEKDGHGDTALHRAAKKKLIKHCSRLLMLGASTEAINRDGKRPLGYLTPDEQSKMDALRMELEKLFKSVPESLSAVIAETRSGVLKADPILQLQNLENLYACNELKPLMDLAALASLGWHNLSKRKIVVNPNGYDSDGEDREGLTNHQKFCINIDTSRTNVGGIKHFGDDGQAGEKSYGVYISGESSIAVGGKTMVSSGAAPDALTAAQVRATVFHEMTHFIAYELFENACNPYPRGADNQPTEQESKFTEIAKKLEIAAKTGATPLDPILRGAFCPGYSSAQYHAELIARVPQMIIAYPDDGRARLEEQAPDLWNYYKNIFLFEVKKHINKLEKRALGDWPKEMFLSASEANGGGEDAVSLPAP